MVVGSWHSEDIRCRDECHNGCLSLLGLKLAGLKARNLENRINGSFGSCLKSEDINEGISNGTCRQRIKPCNPLTHVDVVYSARVRRQLWLSRAALSRR
jgi:hypothetical protein